MKKLEKILITIVLFLSISAIGFMNFWETDNQNNTVTIKVDDQVVKRISLGDNSKQSMVYDFEFNQNTGYVEINKGKVRMLEMSRDICPKSICSLTGWIDKAYQSIVCLPNKIVVAIEGNYDDNIDDTVY